MIRRSFIFLERFSTKKEQQLWKSGVSTWDEFLKVEKVKGIVKHKKPYFDRQIKKAQKNLYVQNAPFFCGLLPSVETWRIYDFFKQDAVYLDIETTGSPRRPQIVIVGLFDGIDTKIMVKGINLDFPYLKEYLKQFKLIVTFNGSTFDLPILERHLCGILPSIPHLDLRFTCHRAGFDGGLKSIEKQIGIERPEDIVEFQSVDALSLWQRYTITGNKKWLNLLVRYNEEDIINLKKISEVVYDRLTQKAMEIIDTGR